MVTTATPRIPTPPTPPRPTVLGPAATLILFYVALAGLGLSIAAGGIGPFFRGSGSVTALAVGVIALVGGVFAAVRVYRLVTE